MTHEEKQLLLTDLCGRLPHSIKVLYREEICTIDCYSPSDGTVFLRGETGILLPDIEDALFIGIEEIKPYLRPMPSMTEEEKEYIKNRWCCEDWDDIYDFLNRYQIDAADVFNLVDWLNKKMFDYRGLIKKRLAIEASEGMYKEEEK